MRIVQKLFLFASLLVCLSISISRMSREKASPTNTKKIKLRILYAGYSGSAREKDFSDFLEQHFIQVGTLDLANFDAIRVKNADVMIFDYDGEPLKAPLPKLPTDYRRATMTIGVVGANICNERRLKTGYL